MLSVTSYDPPAGKEGQGRCGELVAMPQRGAEPLVLVWTRSPRWPCGYLGSDGGRSWVRTGFSSSPEIVVEVFPLHPQTALWKNKTASGVKSGWFQPFLLRDEETKMDFLL